MTTKDHKDGRIITFSKPLGSRTKILCAFYSLSLLIAGGISIYLSVSYGDLDVLPLLIVIAITAILLFAGLRFLDKAFMREEIFINSKELQLINESIVLEKIRSFDVHRISNFRHLNKPELTKHPLAGETFDYLGFQTEQKLINEMHGDNRLAFDYEGNTISFGENVYSWEFEELQVLLYSIAGNNFGHIDELQKQV